MAEEIVNRVAQSSLKVIDLEDFYPQGNRITIDIKDWLLEGLVLREKDFRDQAKEHPWENYKDAFVSIVCSSDAIVPTWAYMLISSNLEPFAKKIIYGSLEELESSLYQNIIESLDISEFKDKPVIIKGCSNKPVPTNAYLFLINKLKPVAKSVMFGEACSAVPLYKRK